MRVVGRWTDAEVCAYSARELTLPLKWALHVTGHSRRNVPATVVRGDAHSYEIHPDVIISVYAYKCLCIQQWQKTMGQA
jgi:hypothetical protein